jgi:hypothetical protein
MPGATNDRDGATCVGVRPGAALCAAGGATGADEWDADAGVSVGREVTTRTRIRTNDKSACMRGEWVIRFHLSFISKAATHVGCYRRVHERQDVPGPESYLAPEEMEYGLMSMPQVRMRERKRGIHRTILQYECANVTMCPTGPLPEFQVSRIYFKINRFACNSPYVLFLTGTTSIRYEKSERSRGNSHI